MMMMMMIKCIKESCVDESFRCCCCCGFCHLPTENHFPLRLAWCSCKWEARKAMHMLSIIVGILLASHAPATSIRYIMGVSTGLYVLDTFYGMLER